MSNITFTPIPKWILKSRILSAAELYVFSFMYDGWNYARKNGDKYQISLKKLISEIGFDKKTILSAIEKMEKNEILSVTRDKRDDNRDAKNIYEFNTEKVWVEKTPLTPNNSSENESGENSRIRVEKTPLHTKENKEKKNNNITLVDKVPGSKDSEFSSKTQSELESEHYDTVVLPQLRRIELWDENPEPEGYKQISVMSGWNDFPQAADWFENDIRSKVSEDEWNQYLCIDFNRVKDRYLQRKKTKAV